MVTRTGSGRDEELGMPVMNELAVITPSFGPDAELFAELHRSVLQYTSQQTVHHVIVPDAHQNIFARYAGPRCRLWLESELVPRRYLRVRRGVWLNARKPWPPVRGWVMQQALKIATAGLIDAEAVLIADSDVVLVRQTSSSLFTDGGQLCLHRLDGAVHGGMQRHVRWHEAARRLLGLDQRGGLPLPDYVSSLNIWDPKAVRAMQQRINEVTGLDWLDAFTSELHISEFILYGVFIDEVLSVSTSVPVLDPAFCHNYWDRTPLDVDAGLLFADRLPSQAIGMMISAKSQTPLNVRLAAAHRCAVRTGNGRSG